MPTLVYPLGDKQVYWDVQDLMARLRFRRGQRVEFFIRLVELAKEMHKLQTEYPNYQKILKEASKHAKQ